MLDFTFDTTPSIRQISGGAAKLGEVVGSLSLSGHHAGVLLVTDAGLMKLGLADAAVSSLRECGFDVAVFDRVEPDPKVLTVTEAVSIAVSRASACVVGFGGGSSMDVAKLVAVLATSDQPLDEMYGVNRVRGSRLPLVLVPTTAGTGSEVTSVSILTTGTEEKRGIVSSVLLPDIALLDSDLTLGLPGHITAATGIDAMVHAIEAFTSRSANNNPVSRVLAKRALDLLGANIGEVVFNGSNRQARSRMLLGSMLAGQAFANSPVAAVHALAYPLGSLFHIPHGLSNALVLEAVMRFNASECWSEYAELAPHVFPDMDTDRGGQAVAADFMDRLGRLTVELGLEAGLGHVGVSRSDIPRLASDAMKQTRLLVNNPREVRLEDAQRIYEACF